MSFQYPNYGSPIRFERPSQALQWKVDRAPDYYAGELESLRSELNATREVLGELLNHLDLPVEALGNVLGVELEEEES